jgi:demethylmenaquinone methyltransferase/2-methoxy-6-polyprenyl-1,4-benzoquinol methylase
MSFNPLTLQTYYSARAARYDEIYLKVERQSDLSKIRNWLPSKFDRAHVLEIACGTGYWTQYIAPRAASLVAIDTAAETLSIAKARLDIPTVVFQIGDAYDLPKVPQNFNAAFAGFWFSHVPKSRIREFLKGLSNRLQPHSRVVFLDNLYVEGSSSRITEVDAEGNTYQTRQLANGSTYKVLKNFPTECEMHDAIQGIGRDAQWTCWDYYWAFEYRTHEVDPNA